ncbi:hypothetical protein ACFPC0_38585 [Streptomyces andamanensis]|uniref:Uncharacterized protein n=1 Tax=Streptomyces andamanensis TaxID=1565035 RepID=A0ABV8TSS9_9ACTN|nr:hypothetical protein [Streptomyces sp. Tu 6176]EYT79678.1 hypothetical protein CF54_29870 [Streptomyces sp. Tu 6176]
MTAAGPASASDVDWQILTSDSGRPGGIAQWSGPDTFRVCDNQADGLRAWGRATWGSGSSTTLQDANGAGTCTTGHTNSLKAGVPLTMEICLRDGPTGPLRYCVTKTGKA